MKLIAFQAETLQITTNTKIYVYNLDEGGGGREEERNEEDTGLIFRANTVLQSR